MPPIDDGHAVHYTAVTRGTPVYSSDEQQVGTVVEVLDNFREHIFDGLVIETSNGVRRFVDAPEVARTAERAVTLTITAADTAELSPPPDQPGLGGPGLGRPGLGETVRRLFRGRRGR
jgi:hypothetical protein